MCRGAPGPAAGLTVTSCGRAGKRPGPGGRQPAVPTLFSLPCFAFVRGSWGGGKKNVFKMLENKTRPTGELLSESALCFSYHGSISPPYFQDCAIVLQNNSQINWKSGSQP